MTIFIGKILIFIDHWRCTFFLYFFLWLPDAETCSSLAFRFLLTYKYKIWKLIESSFELKKFCLFSLSNPIKSICGVICINYIHSDMYTYMCYFSSQRISFLTFIGEIIAGIYLLKRHSPKITHCLAYCNEEECKLISDSKFSNFLE